MRRGRPHGGPPRAMHRCRPARRLPIGGPVNAREQILSRLRLALSDGPAPVDIPRRYATARTGDLVALLTDRLVDYRAHVHDDVSSALSGVSRLLVPSDVPTSWLASFDGTVVVDDGLDLEALDQVDAV